MKPLCRRQGAWIWLLAILVTTAFAPMIWSGASAAELPAIKTEQPAQATALVGQRVTFHVDLQAKGQFAGSPHFVLPDVPGILLMQSEDRPVLSSTAVDEDDYVIERFDFLIFAKQAGAVTIPPIKVRFGSIAGFGQPVTQHDGSTDPITVDMQLPAGMTAPEQMPIVSSHVEVTQNWQPQPGAVVATCKIGDAFRRTITVQAQDGLSMLLPPFKTPQVSGLKIYLAAPQLMDSSERGDATASRTETITYICVETGRSTIPAVAYRWWNLDSGTWEKAVLPALRLTVDTTGIATQKDPARPLSGSRRSILLLIIAVVLAAAFLMGRGLVRRSRQSTPDDDQSCFKRLLIACRRGDPAAAYTSYLAWSLTPTGTPRAGLSTRDMGAEIRQELRRAQDCLLSEKPWNGRDLLELLKIWRRLTLKNHSKTRHLPPLN